MSQFGTGRRERTMNHNKLKGAIIAAGYSQRKLAETMPMTLNTLNAKVNGKSPITIEEAIMLGKKLNLNDEQYEEIFLREPSRNETNL